MILLYAAMRTMLKMRKYAPIQSRWRLAIAQATATTHRASAFPRSWSMKWGCDHGPLTWTATQTTAAPSLSPATSSDDITLCNSNTFASVPHCQSQACCLGSLHPRDEHLAKTPMTQCLILRLGRTPATRATTNTNAKCATPVPRNRSITTPPSNPLSWPRSITSLGRAKEAPALEEKAHRRQSRPPYDFSGRGGVGGVALET